MHTSLFELFKIDIGPSNSHPLDSMPAAVRFARERGHGTPGGMLMGLTGESPDIVAPAAIDTRIVSLEQLIRTMYHGWAGDRCDRILKHKKSAAHEVAAPLRRSRDEYASIRGSLYETDLSGPNYL